VEGNFAQATPISKEAGAIVKQHGETAVRLSICYSGPHAGQLFIGIVFADWETFGRTQQALAADANFQRLYAQALRHVELQERSLFVTEDL